MESQAVFKNEYYLLGEDIFKVITVSRGTNEVSIENIETGERFTTPYDTFTIGYQRVLKIKDVADILNRSTRSIYRYEYKGQIKKPKRYATKHGERIRFYSADDILEIRDMISDIHQGRPNKKYKVVNNTTPSKYEVRKELRERYGVG